MFDLTLPTSLKEVLQDENFWIARVFVIVFCTLVIAFFVRIFFKHLLKKAEKTKNLWDDALLGAAMLPVNGLIWLLGICWAGKIAGDVADVTIFESVDLIRHLGLIAILGWFLVRFISRAENNLMDPEYTSEPMDTTTVMALAKLLRISVIITAVLVAMQSLGYSISGVLAFGGIGGLAVGFAAKDMLANFFGGLMIYLDRPFAVGDWVRSPDQEIEGTVEDIGWRLTRIRTFDKRPLYIPNATFTHISVENPSRMLNRRIYETVGVRYEDASRVQQIINDVKGMLQNHSDIDTSQTMIVNLNKFGAYSLDFFVYAYTKTTDWVTYHQVKQDVLMKVLEIIAKNDAQCAFPTSSLHVPDGVDVHVIGDQ